MIIDREQLKALAITILNESLYPYDINIVLNREKKSGIVSKISSSINEGKLDISKYLNFKKENDIVEYFYTVLITKLPHCNLAAFNKNIQSLKIEEAEKSSSEKLRERITREILGAVYNSLRNKIKTYPEEYSKLGTNATQFKAAAITHELLHMATTYRKGLIEICGFQQTLGQSYQIGKGLNEGYTEYLNNKYFVQTYPLAYPIFQSLSRGIEMIIGEKTMESLYFDGDLKTLIEKLGEYCTKEQALKIVQKMDQCYYQRDNGQKEAIANELKVELANIYISKQKRRLSANEITKDEYEDHIVKAIIYTKGYSIENEDDRYQIRKQGVERTRTIGKEPYDIMKKTILNNRQEPYVVTLQDVTSYSDDPFVMLSHIVPATTQELRSRSTKVN